MVVDTSVLVAIEREEPGFRDLAARIIEHGGVLSAASYVEFCMATISNRDATLAMRRIDLLLEHLEIEVADVTAEDARLAREAFIRFGKGRENAAKLNMGDLFSYALAKRVGQPLLFKGNDFVHTDVLKA